MMRRYLLLMPILLCVPLAAIAGGIEFTVTVPCDTTVTMRTDSGPQRVEITGGGAYVSVYNLSLEDKFTVIKDPSLP